MSDSDTSGGPETGGGSAGTRAVYDAATTPAGAEPAGGAETARRCAEALARFAADPTRPVAEFGCGAGGGGLALRAAGFDCIDGFDRSDDMLAHAAAQRIYRHLATIDLAQPLGLEPGAYANAAAIGVIDPARVPPTAIDELLAVLPTGGCLVFSLDAEAAADGSVRGRICDLTDTGAADLMLADEAPPQPGAGPAVTVYVLRRR